MNLLPYEAACWKSRPLSSIVVARKAILFIISLRAARRSAFDQNIGPQSLIAAHCGCQIVTSLCGLSALARGHWRHRSASCIASSSPAGRIASLYWRCAGRLCRAACAPCCIILSTRSEGKRAAICCRCCSCEMRRVSAAAWWLFMSARLALWSRYLSKLVQENWRPSHHFLRIMSSQRRALERSNVSMRRAAWRPALWAKYFAVYGEMK